MFHPKHLANKSVIPCIRTTNGSIATVTKTIAAHMIQTVRSEVNVSSIYTVGTTIKTCTKFLFLSHILAVDASAWIKLFLRFGHFWFQFLFDACRNGGNTFF